MLSTPDAGPGEDAQGDLGTGDLAAGGGELAPAQGVPRARRRRGQSFDLVGEATRLIAIRDALRTAEAGAAARNFQATKRAELEREVITVPAAELASWFQQESTP